MWKVHYVPEHKAKNQNWNIETMHSEGLYSKDPIVRGLDVLYKFRKRFVVRWVGGGLGLRLGLVISYTPAMADPKLFWISF